MPLVSIGAGRQHIALSQRVLSESAVVDYETSTLQMDLWQVSD